MVSDMSSNCPSSIDSSAHAVTVTATGIKCPSSIRAKGKIKTYTVLTELSGEKKDATTQLTSQTQNTQIVASNSNIISFDVRRIVPQMLLSEEGTHCLFTPFVELMESKHTPQLSVPFSTFQ
jgi:hypothetical protein